MGQKTHPYGFRLGYIRTWTSQWYAKKKDFGDLLNEDIKIRAHIKKTFYSANVPRIEISRAANRIRIVIYSARPGVIIGRRGADIDRLRDELREMTGNKDIYIDIKEIKQPAIEAQLVAENIAFQLEKRIAFRRAMKRAIQLATEGGAQGIKIACAGRLGGAEMSRRESIKYGKVPLHTLRADIDYGFAESLTTYGKIGVKVWIYKGDVLMHKTTGAKDAVGTQKG